MTLHEARTAPVPRYLTRGSPDPEEWGHRVEAMAETLGRPLRPWALDVVPVALAREGGRWARPLVVVSVPRQSGKTTFIATLAIARCMAEPDCRVWYTAQSRLDAVLRMSEMVRLLQGSSLIGWHGKYAPENADAGQWDYRVTIGTGNEVIRFPNGSEIRIFAPRADSLHGSVTDLVVLDEARFFDSALGADLLAAILPSQVTRDGQVWIISTAGGPESTFLAEHMERGRASVGDPRSRVAYGEWSVGDDVAPGDLLEAVWAAHPAAGLPGGPHRGAVELAAETMSWAEFAHEYGNRWRTEAANRLIPGARWAASATAEGPSGEVCFAFDVAVDRSAAAIVACGGSIIEVVEARSGVGWLADRVRQLAADHRPPAIVADAAGPAGATVAALGGLEGLVLVKPRELVAACNGFYDAVCETPPALAHRHHPGLDAAAEAAAQRSTVGSWSFARANGGHLLTAAALAWWAEWRAPAVTHEEPAVW